MGNFRLRKCIGIVVQGEFIEFFKSNVRESIKIKLNFPGILDLLSQFDGTQKLNEIYNKYPQIKPEQLNELIFFLNKNNILIDDDISYDDNLINNNHRLINFLEDYCYSTSEVLKCLENLKNSVVAIVGLGAVGSNIALYLAQCGIENFILIDKDSVELSNLHRQFFLEMDLGSKKTLALSKYLKKISPNINIDIIDDSIDTDFFEMHQINSKIDLIINCADEPSVDYTSNIIALFCMKHKIPHIVGGGYNLHQTLIGQTIIPFETACFQCFSIYLEDINSKDLLNVKKLDRPERKLGSYSPLSGIAATLASLDAVKLLSGKKEYLLQTNKRIEFNQRNLSFNIKTIIKNSKCIWCGDGNE